MQHLRDLKPAPRLAIPVILGVLFACGDQVAEGNGSLYGSMPALLAKMVLFAALFVVAFCAGERLIKFLANRMRRSDVSEGEKDSTSASTLIRYDSSVRNVLVNGCVIGFCWLPYVFCLYPGVYWSDTSLQLLMRYGVKAFTDHHPFFDTLLFGAMADLGKVLFNNAILGLYVLVVIQLIAAILLFAYMTIFLYGLGLSRKFCHLLLAFFALFPLFPVMFCSLAKDTISVLFFIPFSMMYVRAFATKGESLENARSIVLLFALTVLSCLTKKAMVYILVPSLVALLFARMSNRAKVAGMTVGLFAGVLMMVVIPKIVLPALHIKPGGKQESIPFAIQEVAHDVKYNGDTLSEKDKKTVSNFLTIKYGNISKAYDWQIADPVKGTSLRDSSLMGEFLRLWLRQWVKHPMGHFESWMGLTQGWFSFTNGDGSPSYLVVCTESAWYYDPILTYVPQWPLKAAHSGAARSIYDAIESIPVINVLFYRSTWASILPCFLLYLLCADGFKGKRFQSFLATTPVVMSFLYLMLVPVSGMGGEPTRYVFQIVCTLPLYYTQLLSPHGEGAVNFGRRVYVSKEVGEPSLP